MKINIRNIYYVFCIVCVPVGTLKATTNGVTTMPLFTDQPSYQFQSPNSQSSNWLGIWQNQINTRSSVYVSDAFGWQSTLGWIRQIDRQDDLRISYVNAGEKVIRRTFLNSLRESVVELPSISNSKTLLDTLITGTFAHTSEEAVRSDSVTPIASQISWWRDMRSNGNIIGGFRPLDGYMYGAFRFGKLDGHPMGTALIRCRYDPILLRSSVEEQMSLFLPLNSAIIFGSSYGLTDIHSNDHQLNWSASFTHSFNTNWNSGILVASISSNNHEMLASIQLDFPWP